MTTLGSYLREHRLKRGLTQRQVKKHVGFSSEHVSAVEVGLRSSVKEESLRRWAEFVGANPDYAVVLSGRVPQDIVEWLKVNPKRIAAIRTAIHQCRP